MNEKEKGRIRHPPGCSQAQALPCEKGMPEDLLEAEGAGVLREGYRGRLKKGEGKPDSMAPGGKIPLRGAHALEDEAG
jgi:hypothetical protein